MKKVRNKWVGFLLLFFWTQTVPVAAIHSPEVFIQEMYVDYKPVESMETAYINERQVMIPLKEAMKALGKSLIYNPVANYVTIEGDQDNPEVGMNLENGTITLDGAPYQGEGTIEILNQRTYLPLHWLVEFYGYQVYCEEVTRSVYINRNYTMLPDDYKGFRQIKNLPKPTFISHAGGMAAGLTYTNSQEAIKNSLLRGNYFVELDFLFTTDNQVVLGHNWSLMGNLMKLPEFPVSHKTFMENILADDLTQLDLAHLVTLMEEEERLIVVTDTKEENLALLTLIAQEYPHVKQRFIPQVYDEEEYKAAATLGYKHIIYSLYQVHRTDDQVLEFATRYKPYAITMPTETVNNGLAEKLKAVGVHTYAHTVNTEEELVLYQEKGVDGVYTDTLPVIPSEEPPGEKNL